MTAEVPHASEAALETLLEQGKAASALLLVGDFTEAERDLIRRAYEIGRQHGRSALEARLAEAERVRVAAQDFIDTMNLRHSDVEGREVPSGFSIESNPAAIRLFDALAALPSESAEAGPSS